MKTFLSVALVGFSAFASLAFADDGAHDGDESSKVSCQVLDAQGRVLTGTAASEINDDVFKLSGEGEIFAFSVVLDDGDGRLELIDKRSGDKATLHEGDFDIGETVELGLVTDEAPDAGISLVCKGE